MTPKLFAIAGVFCVGVLTGWGVRGASRPAGWLGRMPAPAAAATAPKEAASCSDPAAMEANANLVGQVGDYKRRLEHAEQHVRATELKAHVAERPSSRLVTSREEWARMAREGTIRLRVPCTHWNQSSSFIATRANGGYFHASGASAIRADDPRMEAAGLSSHELDALDGVYERVTARTWAVIRSHCEARPSFRDMSWEQPPTDAQRIEACQRDVLPERDASTKAILTRVAELHAAGAGIDRAPSDEQRIVFAVSNAPAVLHDEMVRLLGKEKTTRAIDNGVLCLNETLYDLRPAEEPESHDPDHVDEG